MFVLYGGLVIDSNYIWDGVVMWLERYLIGEVEKLKVLKSYERFSQLLGKIGKGSCSWSKGKYYQSFPWTFAHCDL